MKSSRKFESIPIGGSAYKSVATWIPLETYSSLRKIAEGHNVSIATYLRAIIIDVVDEENPSASE